MKKPIFTQIEQFVRRVFIGLAAGAVLGFLAYAFASPSYETETSLRARWTQEEDVIKRDQYAILLFERFLEGRGNEEEGNFLPIVMSAYIRQGNTGRFRQLFPEYQRRFSGSFRFASDLEGWIERFCEYEISGGAAQARDLLAILSSLPESEKHSPELMARLSNKISYGMSTENVDPSRTQVPYLSLKPFGGR